jgi:hypothetical protein
MATMLSRMRWWRGRGCAGLRDFSRFAPVYAALAEASKRREPQVGMPEFNDDGVLPEGIYLADVETFAGRFGTNSRRLALLAGMRRQFAILRDCACRHVLLGGSFISSKRYPGDFDGCWDGSGVDIEQLGLLEPGLLGGSHQEMDALEARDGGVLLPWRYIQPLSASYAEFLQFDARTHQRKGVVLVKLQP